MSQANDFGPIQEPPKRRTTRLTWLVAILAILIFAWAMKPLVVVRPDGGMRMLTANNLKQIGVAMHVYDETFEGLPARAICDKEGKPLLSWRVAILPFMEQGNLYNEFKLDEPWDSEHNKALILKMPRVYANPRTGDAAHGLTYCKAVTGRNSVFDSPLLKDKLWLNRWSVAELGKSPRGTENMILCIETGDPVIWTKPEDFECDPDKPLPEVKPQWSSGFLALMADAHVISVRKDFKESAMRAAIDPHSTSKESLDQ